MVELRCTADLRYNGGPETLGGDDAESTNPAANGDVRKHVLLPISRSYPEGDEETTEDYDAGIGQKPRSHDVFLHFLDVGHGRFLRGIQDDNDTAHNTEEAGNLANHA